MDTLVASRHAECVNCSAAWLLRLLRPGDETSIEVNVGDLSAQAWEEGRDFAQRHGVAPLLYRALRAGNALAGLPAKVSARLEECRRTTALDNLRIYGEFRRVAEALRKQEIPALALKGLHLAELVYRDISLRPMVDLDLLVHCAQRRRAFATLRALGYEYEEHTLKHASKQDRRDAIETMLEKKYHVGMVHDHLGTVVEIHWSLADPLHPYHPPLEDIWRSAVPAKLGDAEALVMAPEFLLLHVCAHLAYNHIFAFGLRALCDIAEIVRVYPALDWALVTEQGRRHGWRVGIAAALRLARDHVGAKVPSEVLAAIGGDDMQPQLLAEALEHLLAFSEIPAELQLAPNLMVLAGRKDMAARFSAFRSRLFVPRAELALIYGVPEQSPRIKLYYVLRLRDLIRRYAASAWAFSVSNPRLAATTARHARLAKWIAVD